MCAWSCDRSPNKKQVPYYENALYETLGDGLGQVKFALIPVY